MRKTRIMIPALLAGLMITSIPALAADIDLSNLESLSVQELQELDQTIHALLESASAETEPETESVEGTTAEAADAIFMTEEAFFEDILASYNARYEIPIVTTSEWNMMSYEEEVAYYTKFALAEKEFAEKYADASFEDMNIQYLCKLYVTGLNEQILACQLFEDSKKEMEDYTFFQQNWTTGYRNRSLVIVECKDDYHIAFPDSAVAEMRSEVNALESLDQSNDANAQAPYELVREVQSLLNEIGFKFSTVDGVSGRNTVKAIKRFQEIKGYEVDGLITEELLKQLQEVKEEMAPAKAEAETETASETETPSEAESETTT